MPRFIISYAFENSSCNVYHAFLSSAQNFGLLYVFAESTCVSFLPPRCVWGEFDDINAADAAFNSALFLCGFNAPSKLPAIESRFIVPMENFRLFPGKYKAPNSIYVNSSAYKMSLMHQKQDAFFRLAWNWFSMPTLFPNHRTRIQAKRDRPTILQKISAFLVAGPQRSTL